MTSTLLTDLVRLLGPIRFLRHVPLFIKTWILYWRTGDCDHVCGHIWIHPYISYPDKLGPWERIWVPECGCPVHDWRD